MTLLVGESLYQIMWQDRGKDQTEETWSYRFEVRSAQTPHNHQASAYVYVLISAFFTDDWSDALGGYPTRNELQFVAARQLKTFLDQGDTIPGSTPVLRVQSAEAEREITTVADQDADERVEALFRQVAAVDRRALLTAFDVAIHLRLSVDMAERVCAYLEEAQLLQALVAGYRLHPKQAVTASAPLTPQGYTPNPPTGIPVTLLKVMIAAPGDVGAKVDIIKAAIYDWNINHAVTESVILLPWYWEQVAVPASGEYAQMVINKQLADQAHMIVAVFGNRLGTPTPVAPSGTAEELQRFLDSGRPFLAYFSNEPVPRNVDRGELDRLDDFKRGLQPHVLYRVYDNDRHLAELVTQGLTRKVRELCGRPQ